MNKLRRLFRQTLAIRGEERLLALMLVVILVGLQVLNIVRFGSVLSPLSADYWSQMIDRYHVSGFDSITYYTLSDWHVRYNCYRHPLLAFMMYVPYLLNKALMTMFGVNFAIYIVAMMTTITAFYSGIYAFRVFRDLVHLDAKDSTSLVVFFFSFAYILLTSFVPDHFIYSLLLLIVTLYICGRKLKAKKPLSRMSTIILFVLTAGVSLNNGLKTFWAACVVNGRRFWHPKNLLLIVIVPSMLMWALCRVEYHYLVMPDEVARHQAKAKKLAERTKQLQEAKATQAKTAEGADSKQKTAARKPKAKKKANNIQGTPLMQGEFMRWTDISTSRSKSIVENLFGESLILHEQLTLGDIFRGRPVIVTYQSVIPYIIEALVVLLFICGIVAAWRNRLFWIAAGWFAMDMMLHIGLGFGINEVYIMTAHWAFVIPLAVACLLRRTEGKAHTALSVALWMITAFLLVWNGFFITRYMLG